jgi:hypothetical protein
MPKSGKPANCRLCSPPEFSSSTCRARALDVAAPGLLEQKRAGLELPLGLLGIADAVIE